MEPPCSHLSPPATARECRAAGNEETGTHSHFPAPPALQQGDNYPVK